MAAADAGLAAFDAAVSSSMIDAAVAASAASAGAGIAGSAAGAGAGAGATSGLTLSNLATGASAVNAGLGLTNALSGKKTPAAPSLTPPIIMPSADDEATKRARAAAISKLSQRRGRTSTILSNDTLGGN